MKNINHEYLNSILDYNSEVGGFIWKTSRMKEKAAGSKNTQGYIQIMVDGKNYFAHRLAFFFMEKRWPKQIDHINRKKDDNRWSNLRECDKAENVMNVVSFSHNTSGYKGVSWIKDKRKWRASIGYKGKTNHIAYFDDKHEAAMVYNERAKYLYGDFACLNNVEEFIKNVQSFI